MSIENTLKEMKKKGMKNYIEVTSLKNSSTLEADDDDTTASENDGIPVVKKSTLIFLLLSKLRSGSEFRPTQSKH